MDIRQLITSTALIAGLVPGLVYADDHMDNVPAKNDASFAQPNPVKSKYSEPTRGFFVEHAMVAKTGQAAIDLQTGLNNFGVGAGVFGVGSSSGGGVRLGLPQSELILNSSTGTNEAMLKWSMPDFNTSESSSTPIHWAILGGFGHLDIDAGDSEFKQTNFRLGATATVEADAGTFTIAPQLIMIDSDIEALDDSFLNVDLSANVGIIDTEAGLFSVGAEVLFTTLDDADTTFALGGRWLYNKNLTLDFVPFVFSNTDLIGLPGLIRVSAAF